MTRGRLCRLKPWFCKPSCHILNSLVRIGPFPGPFSHTSLCYLDMYLDAFYCLHAHSCFHPPPLAMFRVPMKHWDQRARFCGLEHVHARQLVQAAARMRQSRSRHVTYLGCLRVARWTRTARAAAAAVMPLVDSCSCWFSLSTALRGTV